VVVHDGSTAGGHPLVKQLSDLSITATATELNYNDITTLGTVEASKVVTADANGDVTFPDNEKLKLGTGGDLEIYHDANHSYLQEGGTGALKIKGDDVRIEDASGNNIIKAVGSGSAELYEAGSKKLETTALGIDVTGELIADSYNETYAAVTSFSNPPASGTAFSFSIEIIQDASASGYTVTWPTSVDWPSATAPTLTATASAKDVFVFYTRDGGTNWYGFTAGQALG
jgi:hypothetical protein